MIIYNYHTVYNGVNFFRKIAIQILQEKCDKLEKEKTELAAKMQAGDFVDLDTLHQVKQEKHKLQKEVMPFIT